jgi:hypothetical protein
MMLGRDAAAPRVRRVSELPDDGVQLADADLKWVLATCDKMQCLFSASGTGDETTEAAAEYAAEAAEGAEHAEVVEDAEAPGQNLLFPAGTDPALGGGAGGGEAPSRWAACADVIPRVLAQFDREQDERVLREVAGIREYANSGRGGSASGLQGVRALFVAMRGAFASRTIAIKNQMVKGMVEAGADRNTVSAVERVSARYYVAIKGLLDGIDGPTSLAEPRRASSRPPTTDEISATFRNIEAAGRAAQESATRFREASALFAKLEQALRTRSADGKFMTFGGGFWGSVGKVARTVGKVARFVVLCVHDATMWCYIGFTFVMDFGHLALLARLEMLAMRLLLYGSSWLRSLSTAAAVFNALSTSFKNLVWSMKSEAIDLGLHPDLHPETLKTYDFTVMNAYVHNCITQLEENAANRGDIVDRAVKEGVNLQHAKALTDMLSLQPCNEVNIQRATDLIAIVERGRVDELADALKDWAQSIDRSNPLFDATKPVAEQSLLLQTVAALRSDPSPSPLARYLIAQADLRPEVDVTHFKLIDMILRVGIIKHTYTPLILAMKGGRVDFKVQYALGLEYCKTEGIPDRVSWKPVFSNKEYTKSADLSPQQLDNVRKMDAYAWNQGQDNKESSSGGGSGAAASLRRSFTVVEASRGDKGGRYWSASPDGAAAKAARRRLKRGAADSMRLTVRETTRGATPAARKRLFAYAVDQQRLPKAVVRTLDGRTVRFTTQVTVHRV